MPEPNNIGHDPRFPEPENGASALVKYKDSWTGSLGSRSVTASYAVIAGAWAVFGSELKGIQNPLALLAITIAIAHIGISLFLIYGNVCLIRDRFKFSQRKPDKWKKEWANSKSHKSRWPYTFWMMFISALFQFLNVLLPFLAATSLIFAFWYKI